MNPSLLIKDLSSYLNCKGRFFFFPQQKIETFDHLTIKTTLKCSATSSVQLKGCILAYTSLRNFLFLKFFSNRHFMAVIAFRVYRIWDSRTQNPTSGPSGGNAHHSGTMNWESDAITLWIYEQILKERERTFLLWEE